MGDSGMTREVRQVLACTHKMSRSRADERGNTADVWWQAASAAGRALRTPQGDPVLDHVLPGATFLIQVQWLMPDNMMLTYAARFVGRAAATVRIVIGYDWPTKDVSP